MMYGTEKRFQKMFELSQNMFNTILEALLDDAFSHNDAIDHYMPTCPHVTCIVIWSIF